MIHNRNLAYKPTLGFKQIATLRVIVALISLLSLSSMYAQTSVTPDPGFDLAYRYANPGVYFVTIPANVSVIRVKLWGAGGGGGTFPAEPNNTGGAGGFTRTDFPVVPGHVYAIVVGTRGVCDDSAQITPVYGFGGEKNDFCKGGTGGGLTGIFDMTIAPTEYSNGFANAIAGGGGGAAGFDPPYCWARGGNGNMPSPLSGGMGSMKGEDNGTECTVGEKSGGGGGYEGGEQHFGRTGGGNTCYQTGDVGACKGGSGFISPIPSFTNKVIAWTNDWSRFPPYMTDIHYISGYGVGGLGHGPSGNGLAVIEYTCLDNAGPDQSVACYQTGMATMAATGTGTWSLGAGSAGTATITTPTSSTTTVTNFSAVGTYYMVWSNGSCTDTALISVGSNCATGCTTPSCSASGPSGGTTGTSYTFSLNSISPSCASVTWAAPGGTPSSGSGTSAVISWSGAGSYTVTFTATNNCSPSGCSPSATSTCAVNINISSSGSSCPAIQNVCNPPSSTSPASTCSTFNGCINIDYGSSACAVAVGTLATLCVDSCGVTITRTTTVGTGGIGLAAFCSFVPGSYTNGKISYTDQANVTHTDGLPTLVVGVVSGSCPTCGTPPPVSCPTPTNNCTPAVSTSNASTCSTPNGCITIDYSATPCRSPRISVGDIAILCIDSCGTTITKSVLVTAGPIANFCSFTPGTYSNGIVNITNGTGAYIDAIPTAIVGVTSGGPCPSCVVICTADAGSDQTVACYSTRIMH